MDPSPQFQNQRYLQPCRSLKDYSSKLYDHSISMFTGLKVSKDNGISGALLSLSVSGKVLFLNVPPTLHCHSRYTSRLQAN